MIHFSPDRWTCQGSFVVRYSRRPQESHCRRILIRAVRHNPLERPPHAQSRIIFRTRVACERKVTLPSLAAKPLLTVAMESKYDSLIRKHPLAIPEPVVPTARHYRFSTRRLHNYVTRFSQPQCTRKTHAPCPQISKPTPAFLLWLA